MKTLLLSLTFGVLTIIGFFFNPGEPVPGAEVYIEQEGNENPIAFQQTGDNGKVTFAHLSKGHYRIKISVPRQSGKLMKNSNAIDCKLQAGYHEGKKRYFLREPEGFFTINFSKIKRFANKTITPVYITDYQNSGQFVIGKFEVSGNNGAFTMEVRAQKPKKFQKMVEKTVDDVEMITIRNTW